MRRLLLPFLFASAGTVAAQDLPLDTVIALALRHERYSDSRTLVQQIGSEVDKETRSAWQPQATIQAQSTVQNEQIAFPAVLPGFEPPSVPLDFHRVLLNFSQTVYDGSTTRARRELERLGTEGDVVDIEGRELELRGRVTTLYMAVLLNEAQAQLIDLRQRTIQEQGDRMDSAVAAGAALASESAALEAEWITAGQEAVKVGHDIADLRARLGTLTADPRLATADLLPPTDTLLADASLVQRPDIRALDLRMQALDAQDDLATAVRMPTLHVFGNAGIGDPGYNYFKDEWRPMLLVGASLQWRLYDGGTRKRKGRVNQLQRSLLQQDKERLTERWQMELADQRRDLLQYRELIATDDRLVQLREEVSAVKAEQLAQGTITASEYITELNKEHAARLGREVHRLQSLLAIHTCNNILGK
jgi:outer membrane protein TolC